MTELAEEMFRELGSDSFPVRAAMEDPTSHDDVHAGHDAVATRGVGFEQGHNDD